MKFLKTAYEESKSKGLLKTDVIWFNYGWHTDSLSGKMIDDVMEARFDELPDSMLNLRVSDSEWERGTKYYWVENGQLCVGKDSNHLTKPFFQKKEIKG